MEKETKTSSSSRFPTSKPIDVTFFKHPPQSRLITIKAGTNAGTKIRGFTKFTLEVAAPDEMLRLALDAGLGLYNAQGMGCVEVG